LHVIRDSVYVAPKKPPAFLGYSSSSSLCWRGKQSTTITTTKDDNGKTREFPNRPRGRRRPRSAGEEKQSTTSTTTITVSPANFLIVLVVVVVLALPATKSIDDEHDDEGR
jgi:hypothetical protein